jgi:hypothetical protein
MKRQQILRVFDRVRYVGSDNRFASLRGTNAIGEIVGFTDDHLAVVSYGDDAYLLAETSLAKTNFAEDTNEKLASKWAKKAKEDAAK